MRTQALGIQLSFVHLIGTSLLVTAFSTSAPAQRGAITLAYQLTHVDMGEPFPSPDGKKLVFEITIAGFEQLFTMNPDGSGQTQLTHDLANHDTPSWSPDGRRRWSRGFQDILKVAGCPISRASFAREVGRSRNTKRRSSRNPAFVSRVRDLAGSGVIDRGGRSGSAGLSGLSAF
jgi:hypothetical protein